MDNKTLLVLPSIKLKNTGVYFYNLGLKKIIGKNIYIVNTPSIKIFFILNKLILLPIILIFKIFLNKNIRTVVLPEEGYAFLIPIIKIFKVKLIQIVHDFRNFGDFENLTCKERLKLTYLNINYFFLSGASKIIVPSNFVEKRIKKKINIDVLTVPNFIIEKKKEDIKYNKILLKKKYFLLISTNDTYKNISVLIDLFSKKNWTLYWIAKENFSSKRHVSESKIAHIKNIKIFKNINNNKLKRLIKNSQAILSPSLFEGFGRNNIEAQYYKKFIICSNIPIFREINKKNTIFVTKPKIKKNWEIAINNFLKKKIKLKKNRSIDKYILNHNNISFYRNKLNIR